jgi:hypothetical protein
MLYELLIFHFSAGCWCSPMDILGSPHQTVHEVFPHTAFRLSLSHCGYRMFKLRCIELFPFPVVDAYDIHQVISLFPWSRIHTLPFASPPLVPGEPEQTP